MIGLDTTTLIDLYRKDEQLLTMLETIDDELIVNQVTYLEIMMGIKGKNEEEEVIDNVFSQLTNLPLNEQACKKARDIFWQLKKQGKSNDVLDCAIAGIYLAHGVTAILTRNTTHFSRITDLKVHTY